MFRAIDNCPKPVIGRIHGAALGGGAGLAAVCDIVIAADDAVFGFTEVKLGIIPAVISPFVLAKIGASHARALFLTGANASTRGARDAHRPGAQDRAAGRTRRCGRTLPRRDLHRRSGSGRAPRSCSCGASCDNSYDDTRAITPRAIAKQRAGAEGQEGLRAFLERRRRVCKGSGILIKRLAHRQSRRDRGARRTRGARDGHRCRSASIRKPTPTPTTCSSSTMHAASVPPSRALVSQRRSDRCRRRRDGRRRRTSRLRLSLGTRAVRADGTRCRADLRRAGARGDGRDGQQDRSEAPSARGRRADGPRLRRRRPIAGHAKNASGACRLSAADQSQRRRRRPRHARRRIARRSSTKRWKRRSAKRVRRSATTPCCSSAICAIRATSSFKSWPTRTERRCISASASVRFSAAIKRSSRKRRRSR